MKKMGLLSVIIFLVSSSVFLYSFFNLSGEGLNGGIMIFIAIILPIIGLITAFLSKKSALKITGIIGNSIVLFVSVIIPFVSTLFWSKP